MTNATNPTCPHGKQGFAGQRAALRHGRTIRRGGGAEFAYQCATCGEWHLTTQSPQEKRKRAKAAWRAVGHRKPLDAGDDT